MQTQRGSIIVYDNAGMVWANTGDSSGDLGDVVIPVGLPYIETQFGELDGKLVMGVDVETRTLITEDIVIPLTPDQKRISELENILLESEGLI